MSSALVVRDEEVVIVVLVLTVWVAVILLFFNKWGKIRMLEPYQPRYQPPFSRASSLGAPGDLRRLSSVGRLPSRHRQNSVFVGSQLAQPLSRRTKSAEDIKCVVVEPSTQSTAL